jgi:chorismate dehydratase
MPIKLGVVPYLNALPLYHTLRDLPEVQIVAAVPSQLAPMLNRGECDLALIPVVEHFRGVGEMIISNSCIGCTGPVRSVLLFHRVPIEQVQTVALDTSSRSSVALLQVVLHDLWGFSPRYRKAAPDLETMLREHDAALLIGDNALLAAQDVTPDIRVLDLGAAWQQLTGLSFVFAAWVSRRGLKESAELAALLDNARQEGVRQSDEIARQAAQTSPVPQQVIESYFRQSIEYSMTAAHRMGLEEFRARCERNGLLRESL